MRLFVHLSVCLHVSVCLSIHLFKCLPVLIHVYEYISISTIMYEIELFITQCNMFVYHWHTNYLKIISVDFSMALTHGHFILQIRTFSSERNSYRKQLQETATGNSYRIHFAKLHVMYKVVAMVMKISCI